MRLVVYIGAAVVEIGTVGSAAAYPWLSSVGSLRVTARVGEGGSTETSQLAVEVKNDAKQAARLLREPLRCLAEVYDDDDRLFFSGTVQRVDVGRGYVLTIESGGAGTLLSEPLPMATTRELGDFAEDVPLPQRYGDLTGRRFRLIRLNPTEYLAAGHPMDIVEVFVDDEATLAYELDLFRDDQGRVGQIVRFGAPLGTNQVASATGYGKRHPRTGALIENPADLLEDVLAQAGIAALYPGLRTECATEGLRLAGSITEARPVRDIVDEIAHSAGIMWTTGFARRYPVADVAGPIYPLDGEAAGGMDDPYADLEDTADVIRVAYDWSEAAQRAQHAVELTANPKRYGGRSAEIALPWLHLPANAESVGGRILAWMAARRFRVPGIQVNRHDLRPGDAVRLVELPEWSIDDSDPIVMLVEADVDGNASTQRVGGVVVLSTPSVTVTAHSIALPDTTEGGVDVSIRNGVATFTALDDDGRPLFGARMSLDGSEPRTVNDQGQASFPISAGPHELVIEREGYGTIRQTFES